MLMLTGMFLSLAQFLLTHGNETMMDDIEGPFRLHLACCASRIYSQARSCLVTCRSKENFYRMRLEETGRALTIMAGVLSSHYILTLNLEVCWEEIDDMAASISLRLKIFNISLPCCQCPIILYSNSPANMIFSTAVLLNEIKQLIKKV